MIWEMILEKICYTADRSTTKKAVQKTRNGEKA